jgi:hypothetical protein
MNARIRLLLVLLLAAASALPASALLGETRADIKKRLGPPAPQMEKSKESAYWLFEGDDGQLMYSVTFNDKGKSIAEGLKPLKRARFNRTRVMEFIDAELILVRDSPTKRVVKPGEAYKFAGKEFVCAETEYVVVDDERDTLLMWTQSGVPTVLVLSAEMLHRMVN